MAYVINKYNGEQLIVLEDGTIDTSTSINFVGRNYVGYGEAQNENFLYLLENFANSRPPNRPLLGQIWFNTTDTAAYLYNGNTWSPVGAAIISDTEPEGRVAGTLWLDSSLGQMKVYSGSAWIVVGPEAVQGFGSTKARSGLLYDNLGNPKPVIFLEINDVIIGICTGETFTVQAQYIPTGFTSELIAGINLSANVKFTGQLNGTASSATKLATARNINGVGFDGTENITVKASTTNRLLRGTYLTGANFDGSQEITWDVDATSSNVIGKIVARNSTGGFSAGTITATFVGDLTGNVSASSGTSRFNVVEANEFIGATLVGNARTASQLVTPRRINGVNFDGTGDITVTAAAGTLTGNTLNPSITQSGITQLGTLVTLNVADAGINIGSSSQLKLLVDSSTATIRSATGQLNFDMGASGPDVSFVNSATSLSLGGPAAPAILGDNTTNLGITGYEFDKVYANEFKGNADTATLATTATNIAGGGSGALLYQTGIGLTSALGLGSDGYVLKARPNGPAWEALSSESLTKGNYLTFTNTSSLSPVEYFDASVPVTVSVNADSANTASTIVARDSSGNFTAGTITASLVGNVTGNVTGNAGTATKLATARRINGVSFDGTSDITIIASDSSKLPLAGGTLSGYLTLNGNPTSALHATPKQYVDSRLPQYTFVTGNTVYSTSGYTNQVGSWNNGANYFDVFPPSGKTMGNLVAFIPSIAVIHFAGGVNGDDSMRCTWSNLGDRIRVYVQNTEQRSTPAANYLAIWS